MPAVDEAINAIKAVIKQLNTQITAEQIIQINTYLTKIESWLNTFKGKPDYEKIMPYFQKAKEFLELKSNDFRKRTNDYITKSLNFIKAKAYKNPMTASKELDKVKTLVNNQYFNMIISNVKTTNYLQLIKEIETIIQQANKSIREKPSFQKINETLEVLFKGTKSSNLTLLLITKIDAARFLEIINSEFNKGNISEQFANEAIQKTKMVNELVNKQTDKIVASVKERVKKLKKRKILDMDQDNIYNLSLLINPLSSLGKTELVSDIKRIVSEFREQKRTKEDEKVFKRVLNIINYRTNQIYILISKKEFEKAQTEVNELQTKINEFLSKYDQSKEVYAKYAPQIKGFIDKIINYLENAKKGIKIKPAKSIIKTKKITPKTKPKKSIAIPKEIITPEAITKPVNPEEQARKQAWSQAEAQVRKEQWQKAEQVVSEAREEKKNITEPMRLTPEQMTAIQERLKNKISKNLGFKTTKEGKIIKEKKKVKCPYCGKVQETSELKIRCASCGRVFNT